MHTQQTSPGAHDGPWAHTIELSVPRLVRTTMWRSRQCGAVLRCDRGGHAHATDQARRTRQALGVHDRGILLRQGFLCRSRLGQ